MIDMGARHRMPTGHEHVPLVANDVLWSDAEGPDPGVNDLLDQFAIRRIRFDVLDERGAGGTRDRPDDLTGIIITVDLVIVESGDDIGGFFTYFKPAWAQTASEFDDGVELQPWVVYQIVGKRKGRTHPRIGARRSIRFDLHDPNLRFDEISCRWGILPSTMKSRRCDTRRVRARAMRGNRSTNQLDHGTPSNPSPRTEPVAVTEPAAEIERPAAPEPSSQTAPQPSLASPTVPDSHRAVNEPSTSSTGDHGGPSLFTNASSLAAGRLIVAIMGWAGTALIARDLSTEAFGQFTLVFSLLGMLSVVTDLGVGRVVLGGLVDPKQDRPVLAGTYIVLRTALGLLGYGLVLGVVIALGYPTIVIQATAVAGMVVLIATPADAYHVAFQVTNNLPRVAIVNVLTQTAQLALTIALVLRGAGLIWYTVPAVINIALTLVWIAPAAHRLIPIRYQFDWALARRLLREAVPLSAGAAFATLYYRIDSVMLSKLADFEAVGLYGVAYKFVDLVHFIPAALATAILAPLAANWTRSRAEFHRHVHHGIMLSAVAAGLVIVGIWPFASEAISLLYGHDFSEASTVTAILVSGEALAFGSSLFIVVLIAVGRQVAYPVITLAGLVINVGLNLMVIPRYGLLGAGLTTLFTETLVLFALGWWSYRLDDVLPGRLGSLISILPAVGLGLGMGFALERIIGWIPAAVLASLLYLTVIHGLRVPGPNGVRDLLRSPEDPASAHPRAERGRIGHDRSPAEGRRK